MRAVRIILASIVIAACFAAGLYGAPAFRSAYSRIFPEPAFRSGDFAKLHEDANNAVVLFSTSTCPYCRKTRELLEAQGVPYKDYIIDTSADAKARFEAAGGVAVPLIYIGDREIRGFRESAISDALAALHGASRAPAS